MKDLREKLRKVILENVERLDMLGVRSDWREVEIGHKFSNSYLWDHVRDCSSYYTDNPYELPGTCATHVEVSWSINMLDTDDEDEINYVIDEIIDAYEYNKGYDGIQYLVTGTWNDPESLACDTREIILENAEVIFKF